jgi:purine-cytosine permease-like protein
VSPWGTIVLLEHWIYRRTRGYDLDLWWSQKGLPYGIAASVSFACAVVLAIMSMSQVWYVGPIALAAGGEPYGVDLGWCVVRSDPYAVNFQAAALAGVTYPPLRYLELKYVGR